MKPPNTMSASFRPTILLPASLVLLTALSAPAPAEFRLLESESTPRRSAAPWSATLEFQAQPQRARAALPERFPYTMVVTDEVTGEERLVEGRRPEGDPLAEKTLILTPTLLTQDELNVRVTVLDWIDGTVASDGDASDAVVVRPFGMGTALRGIEVIARPGLVRDADGETRTAGRLRIDIEGPAHAAGRLEVNPAALQDPLVQRVLAGNVLNPDAIRARRASEGSTVPPPPLPSPPGQYRLTYPNGNEIFHVQLEDIGVSDPTSLGLLTLDHHGDLLPWHMAPDGGILFYAPRRVTDSDNNDSVFVRMDPETSSAAMRTRPAFTTLAPPETPAEATELGKQLTRTERVSTTHVSRLSTLPFGERFVSRRVERATGTGVVNSIDVPIQVPDIPTNGFLQVQAALHGDSNDANTSPNHVSQLSIPGQSPQTFQFSGFSRVTRSASWGGGLVVGNSPGSIPFTFSVPLTIGGMGTLPQVDVQHLESLTITYLAKPRLDAGFGRTITIIAANQGRVSVGGFPPGTTSDQIIVLDVTNPKDPEFLLNPPVFPDESGGIAAHFQSPAASRTFRIQYLGSTGAPQLITPAESLPDTASLASPLRAIYIRKPEYAEALAPLVLHRGAGVVEISPQAAYNVFNGGQQSKEAITQAIGLLVDRAPVSVAFPAVLLVGHASFDRRNVTGQQLYPQIPGDVVPAPPIVGGGPNGQIIRENMTDYGYSKWHGGDDYADFRLGRIPVRNAADVTRFVNRLLQHEALFGGEPNVARPVVLAAGRGQTGEPPDVFINVHRNIMAPILMSTPYAHQLIEYQPPDTTIPQSFPNFWATRDALQANTGASFLMYLGHGSESLWQGNPQGSQFIRSGQLTPNIPLHPSYIDTRNKWPIAMNFTCLTGRFMNVGRNEITDYTISETLLLWTNPDYGVPGGVLPNEKREDRGAVAAVMPVGAEYAEPMIWLQQQFLLQIAGENATGLHRPVVLGNEWIATSHAYIDNVVSIVPEYQDSLEEFILFGDPDTLTTLVPPLAEYEVALQALPKFANLGDAITLRVRVKAQDIGEEARGLVAQVNLPAGMQYNGASPTVGSVSHNNGVILWNLGSLLPGVEVALDVQVLVLPEANLPVQVTGSVTAITPDFDPANNTAAVTIGPPPDVVDSIAIH